jgi:Flp pilus assembly protein TadB
VDQDPDAPVSITTARESRSSEIRHRQNRYLLSMGVRTACFVGAVVASGVLRWVLVAAAFMLPYVAVVMANASERRRFATPASFATEDRPMIERGGTADNRRSQEPHP